MCPLIAAKQEAKVKAYKEKKGGGAFMTGVATLNISTMFQLRSEDFSFVLLKKIIIIN